jgi:NodT family efflux transporter outer membrane factor (OMF) lipoprotein
MLAGLTGCAWLTPAAPASGIAAPARFVSAGGGEAAWPAPDWWRGFGAPELDRLMEAAVTRGFDVAAAEARVRQADAQIRIAGAALLPAVSLGAQRGRQRSVSSLGGGARLSTSNELSLGASYEIDFWGRNRAAVEAARRTAEATRFDLGTVRITTEASVANTYFQFVGAQEQVSIAQANLAASERVLGVVRARIAAGTATGLELAQQETLVAQQRAQLPPLIQLAEQSRLSLATLAGIVPDAVTATGNVFNRLAIPPVSPGLPSELLARRPDVQTAEQILAAANADIVVARAALLPSISLTGSAGFVSTALRGLVSPANGIWSVAAGLTQPVFQGGALTGQLRLSEARAGELLAEYQRAIVAALVDAESSLVALQQTTEQVRLQAEAVATAERAFAIAEAQLRVGTIDLVALLTSQQSLFDARDTLVRARLARLQAAVGLFRALGGGWGAAAPGIT